MNQTCLIGENKVEKINPRLEERDFVKSDSNKVAQLECWELSVLEREDKKLSFLDSSDEEDDYINIYQDAQVSEGLNLWQQDKWEKDIIYNHKKINAINIMELNWELQEQCLSSLEVPESRLRRIRRKKTVFDLYPVNVDQISQFLRMDRTLFPLFIDDNEVNVTSQFKTAIQQHSAISNGEIQTRLKIDAEDDENLSVKGSKVVIYESSEQQPPFQMQISLTSLLVAYGTDRRNESTNLGVPKIVGKKSPFLGNISPNVPYILALENAYFRVPVFEHSMRSTDFLLVFSGSGISVRRVDTLLLGGKQMPLTLIHNPKSTWFKDILMRMIIQRFLDDEVIHADILGPFLSHFEFLNLKNNLQMIATLNFNQKFWKLKSPLPACKGMEGIDVDEYMRYMSIVTYISSYGYVEADIKRRKAVKQEKKKEYKNTSSPWSISKAYINGVSKGFWKLSHFETPIAKTQMLSFQYMANLVQKKFIDKSDLRKLTVFEVRRLLTKLEQGQKLKQGSTRWKMVQELSARAAVEGEDNMQKYARESKSNKRLLRKKYGQQCEETFEKYREALSNTNYPSSDTEGSTNKMFKENKEISVDEFMRSIKESEAKPRKLLTMPMKRCSENARKLLSEPAKSITIYRVRDNVVEKTKMAVNEILLEYLRQTKQGSKNLKTIYGITENSKHQKQRLRDRKRRQDLYVKKRIIKNLPVDINTQDTTDKICSSCGCQGHIRTNQECPNFGKSIPQPKALHTPVQIKVSTPQLKDSQSCDGTSNIQRQYQSSFATKFKDVDSATSQSSSVKRQRNTKSNANVKRRKITRKDSRNSTEDDDNEFVINIPFNLLNQCNTKPPTEEFRNLTPIQEIKKTTKTSRSRPRKKAPKKELTVTGCMAPFGGEVVYQSDDRVEDDVFPPKDAIKQEAQINSDSDDEFVVNIDKKLLENMQRSKSEIKVEVNENMSVEEDSDDFTIHFSADQWNMTSNCNGNKENIEHHERQEEEDEEFIIHF